VRNSIDQSSSLQVLPISTAKRITHHRQAKRMIARTSRIAFCAWLVLAGTLSALAQTYTITAIGVLRGDNVSSGFWLNSAGQVVGCSDTATSNGYPCTGTTAGQHAFLWSKSAGLKDLGTMSGGTISGATGVNDAGQVVGYSNVKASSASDFFAFLWTPAGGMTNLGTLSGGHSSCAFEINYAGVIAGDSFISSGKVNGVSWTNHKIRNLGGLSKSIFTAALDINDNNQIVGESIFSYGPPLRSHAFEWSAALGMKDLGTLAGGTTSMANAINDSGVMAGQSNSGGLRNAWHAVMWNVARKIQDLGTLPGGTYSVAFGINDSDEVVGYGNIFNNAPHAFLWTRAAGMRDLNSLIPANSGWVLINANAINRLGQITGYGRFKGHNRGFLLSPK
jgi:probable HAF family extracellular repeat protein